MKFTKPEDHCISFTTVGETLAIDEKYKQGSGFVFIYDPFCGSRPFPPIFQFFLRRLYKSKAFVMLCDNIEEAVTHLVSHKAWVSCGKDADSLG